MWPCLLGTDWRSSKRKEDGGALHRRQVCHATDELEAGPGDSRCK